MYSSDVNAKNVFLALVCFLAALVMMIMFTAVSVHAEEVAQAPAAAYQEGANVNARIIAQEEAAKAAKVRAEQQIAEQQKAAAQAKAKAEAEIEAQKRLAEEQKARAEAEKKAMEDEIARKKAEEEARKQAEETQRRFEEALSASGMSDSDFNALCKIVEAEDGHDCIEGRIGIANVILNRVRSPFHPNTIMGVLTAPGQFGPVSSGKFAVAVPSASTIAAVKEAVAGKNTVGGALYFHRGGSFGGRTLVATAGAHSFFV
ncbi:MAG: cell wall hydrolase [Lachnospiraceae bacterium]|nr:cell wall hydrolase [Lachnospiraceae bacterium]